MVQATGCHEQNLAYSSEEVTFASALDIGRDINRLSIRFTTSYLGKQPEKPAGWIILVVFGLQLIIKVNCNRAYSFLLMITAMNETSISNLEVNAESVPSVAVSIIDHYSCTMIGSFHLSRSVWFYW